MSDNLLWIFEMAQNHGGSVEHAKLIIDRFAAIKDDHCLNAGFKFQLRNLDTFIHDDFKDSDLKYVKRFRDTRLTKEQFAEVFEHVRSHGMHVIATPFDEESLPLFDELDIDILKIASCSVDDWPLLRAIARLNKMMVMSTAGAELGVVQRAFDILRTSNRDVSLMHCVAEYPTPPEHAHLNRIDELRKRFTRTRIGISTHESPNERSIVPYAIAKGCSVIEKHVDVETKDHTPNAYSCGPAAMRKLVEDVQWIRDAMLGSSPVESIALKGLRRGVYTNRSINAGEPIKESDLYFAMPLQEGQVDVSLIDEIVGHCLDEPLKEHQPLPKHEHTRIKDQRLIDTIMKKERRVLQRAGIRWSPDEEAEISAHYGLDNFKQFGALILNKVNREYCKKVIAMLPGQVHPSHHHVKKEETFELLHGDCTLMLNGKEVRLQRGKPVLIAREVVHSFWTERGCVIEEVSTTHYPGDSVYEDPEICKLSLEDRKLWAPMGNPEPIQ